MAKPHVLNINEANLTLLSSRPMRRYPMNITDVTVILVGFVNTSESGRGVCTQSVCTAQPAGQWSQVCWTLPAYRLFRWVTFGEFNDEWMKSHPNVLSLRRFDKNKRTGSDCDELTYRIKCTGSIVYYEMLRYWRVNVTFNIAAECNCWQDTSPTGWRRLRES